MPGIDALVAKIERLAVADVTNRIASGMVNATHKACLDGFNQQRNPYGVPWMPRKDKRGTWPLLQKTGAGLMSLTGQSSGGSVVLKIRGYFKFHQSGTKNMVARQVFPDPAIGLGNWSAPIIDAAITTVRGLLG